MCLYLANYKTLEDNSPNHNSIQCNGDESKIADCPTVQTATFSFCHHLLVECSDTLPTAPMPIILHTVAVTSTPPAISSRPRPSVIETDSQRRPFPLATIAAVSVVTIIIAVAVTAIIFGLVFALLTRRRPRHDTKRYV